MSCCAISMIQHSISYFFTALIDSKNITRPEFVAIYVKKLLLVLIKALTMYLIVVIFSLRK